MPHIEELATTLAYLRTRQLRGFGPPLPDSSDATNLRRFDCPLDNTFAPMSQLLRLTLLSCGAAEAAPIEKVFWDLSFSYTSKACTLRHVRSGIKLSAMLSATENPEPFVKDLLQRLGSAVKNIQTNVVEPRIEQQRRLNNVRVINQHSRYAGFVSYCRTRLDRALADPAGLSGNPTLPDAPATFDDDDLKASLMSLLVPIQDELDRAHEIAYLTTALLAGYFSLVQHRLALLTGFSPAALDPDFSVDQLFRDEWADQFASATAGRTDKGDKVALSDLHHLAKEYRNALLHGGGGRLADGLSVEWAPGYHSIVTERGEFTDQFMLWQPALTRADAQEILSKIDRLEVWFTSLPYFPWLESALPVRFDRSSIELAVEHLRKGTVAEYIEREDVAFDRAMNGEF